MTSTGAEDHGEGAQHSHPLPVQFEHAREHRKDAFLHLSVRQVLSHHLLIEGVSLPPHLVLPVRHAGEIDARGTWLLDTPRPR